MLNRFISDARDGDRHISGRLFQRSLAGGPSAWYGPAIAMIDEPFNSSENRLARFGREGTLETIISQYQLGDAGRNDRHKFSGL